MNHLAFKQSNPLSFVPTSPKLMQPGPTVPGNDTSHYTWPVTWGNAAWTMIKFTQGITYHDPEAINIATQAKQRGILRGGYHYFDTSDPIAQAKFFVKAVGANTELPFALDWEEHPNYPTAASNFMNEVEQLSGRECILYSYLAFIEGLSAEHRALLSKHKLWLADLSHGGPHIPDPWRSLWGWQYSFGKGSQPDQDVFYGSLADLKAGK